MIELDRFRLPTPTDQPPINTGGIEGQTAILLIMDDYEDAFVARFVDRIRNQTASGLKLIVCAPNCHKSGGRDGVDIDFIHRDLTEDIQETVRKVIDLSGCRFLALFQGSIFVPTTFFNEIVAFYIAHRDVDLIFFEHDVPQGSSVAFLPIDKQSLLKVGLYSPVILCRTEKLRNFDHSGDRSDWLLPGRSALARNLNAPDAAILSLSSEHYSYAYQFALSHGVASLITIPGLVEFAEPPLQAELELPTALLARARSEYRAAALKTSRSHFASVQRTIQTGTASMRNPYNTIGQTQVSTHIIPSPEAGPDQTNVTETDESLVRYSGLFDPIFYLRENSSDFPIYRDPVAHYVEVGWREGWKVSRAFDSEAYLRINDDVAKAKVNPLLHYLRNGRSEGRSRWTADGEVNGRLELLLDRSGLFDPKYYYDFYEDIRRSGTDPYWHYINHGGREGRNPSLKFDGLWYLQTYASEMDGEHNPLIHYIRLGAASGLLRREVVPSKLFARRLWPKALGKAPLDKSVVYPPGRSASIASAARQSRYEEFQVLCCLPFSVQHNLTLRILEFINSSGCKPILSVRGPTPKEYEIDRGPWSQRAGRVVPLHRMIDEDLRISFYAHLIESRNIRTLLIAGDAGVYWALPELKRRFPNLIVLDQLFNPVGHTRLSLTYSPYIDKYLVENTEMRRFLVERNVHPERVETVASGVDLKRFDRKVVDIEHVRQIRSRISSIDHVVDIVVGYIGRMSPEKDPLGFVEIAVLLAKESPRFKFLLAGNGPMLEAVEADVKKRLPADRVCVLGFVDDVRPAMLACDMLVVPSKIDGRPFAIMQAGALGVPVIATDVGGISELISDSENGMLFGSGRYHDAARIICDLSNDKDRIRSMSSAAVSRAASEFDEGSMYRHYLSAICQAT